MQAWKKTISVLMALCMTLSLCVVGASADDASWYDALSSFGEYSEETNTFTVTRDAALTTDFAVLDGATLVIANRAKLITSTDKSFKNLKGGTVQINENCELDIMNNYWTTYVDGLFTLGTTINNGVIGAYTQQGVNNAWRNSGGTLKLLNDITGIPNLTVDKRATLDLNGHTWTGSSTSGNTMLTVGDDGDLTITGTGTLTTVAATTATPNAMIVNNGRLTIESGVTIDAPVSRYYAISYNKTSKTSDVTVTTVLDGCIIKAGSSAIASNGTDGLGGNVLTVKDATITAGEAGMFLAAKDTVTISGTTSITAPGGIEVKAGTLNIEGCAINATAQSTTHKASSNGPSTTGYAVALVENASYATDASAVEVNISGGGITGPVEIVTDSTRAGEETICVTGGSFSADPAAFVADGCRVYSGGSGSYAYRVSKVPVNKIETAAALVKTAQDAETTEDVSVAVSSSALTVSGKISAANKAVITYTCTDGKTGTVTVTYTDAAFSPSPAAVTVGGVSYSVDVSGMSVLPADVKVAPAAAEAAVEGTPSDVEAAQAAVQAVTTNADKVSAAGLGAAVANETVTSTAQSGETTTNVTIGTAGGSSETKSAEEVISQAKVTVGAPENVTAQDAELVVVVKPVLNIAVKDLVTVEGKKTLLLDVSAQSQVVVTTKSTATDAIKTFGDGANAVAVGEPVEVQINTPVTLTIPVPEGFVTEGGESDLFIRHTMHDGTVETVPVIYNSTDKTITFTITGMSPVDVITDARSCTVYFSDGSSKVYRVSDLGSLPTAAAPAGKQFSGWKLAAVEVAGYDGSYTQLTDAMLTDFDGKNVIATAQFENLPAGVAGFALSFETNGGSAIAKVYKSAGTTVDLSAYKPTKDGFSFAGWYSDKELTKAVSSVKLGSDTTVYAKWEKVGVNPFSDVAKGAYYYDAVLWAAEKGITSGTVTGIFAPDVTCTRAQAVSLLWRANGSPEPVGSNNPFNDVRPDAYYYKAVLWAVEKGITQGTSAVTFSPDAVCTRGQIVSFLYRAAGSPATTTLNPFTDVADTADYYKAVLWAVEKGITKGTGDTTFSPSAVCTRSQIVMFLYQYFEK